MNAAVLAGLAHVVAVRAAGSPFAETRVAVAPACVLRNGALHDAVCAAASRARHFYLTSVPGEPLRAGIMP